MPRSRCLRSTLAFSLAAGLSLSPLAASAQERDTAAAQALFEQARDLVQQGKLAEACPKFQESNRLDPGIGTQFHLADCYEQSGRVASAWALFLDVASQARASGQPDREKVGQQRAEKLLPRLPRLAVNVPETSKTSGLEIRRNGILVGSAQWGTPMPIDPGEVEITVSAPSKQTLRQTVRLEEGKSFSYSVPTLADQAKPAEAVPASPPVAAPPTPTPSKPIDKATTSHHNNVPLVLGLAGAGVVGLGVGTVFAILAKNKDSDSREFCPSSPNSCSADGVNLRNEAIRKGNAATVAFVAGGALLAGAGVVWLLSGSTEELQQAQYPRVWARADIGAGFGNLQLAGTF